jgi:hypothetical protein
MKVFGITTKIVNMVKVILSKTIKKVQIDGTLSDSFQTTSGLRQGDSLYILLLNVVWEKIICQVTANPRSSIEAYADDVIIGRKTQVLKEIIQKMKELINDIGPKINVDKTKYMNTSKYKYIKVQLKSQNIMNNIKKY